MSSVSQLCIQGCSPVCGALVSESPSALSVRCSVLSVSGALDVLHAAGFEEHGEGDDLYVIINCPPPQLPPTVALTYLRLTGT